MTLAKQGLAETISPNLQLAILPIEESAAVFSVAAVCRKGDSNALEFIEKLQSMVALESTL